MSKNPENPKEELSAKSISERAGQSAVGVLTFLAILALATYSWQHRGHLVEIDRAAPREAQFQLDINEADWPEFVLLPAVGEVLARRIVESRFDQGSFADHEDLTRVRGIGPKTLERIRPYLLPMPAAKAVAGGEIHEGS